LQFAAKNGEVEVANMRVEIMCGPSIDAVDERGRTALMTAIIHGNIQIVRIILNAGGDLSPVDLEGNDALAFAQDSPEILKLISREVVKRAELWKIATGESLEFSFQACRDKTVSQECPF